MDTKRISCMVAPASYWFGRLIVRSAHGLMDNLLEVIFITYNLFFKVFLGSLELGF